MEITETIMNIWAKISSLVIFGFVIYAIYMMFSFIGLYLDSQEIFHKFLALGEYVPKTMSLGSTIFYILALLFTIVFGLAFYSPFIYYAWVKKPNDEGMKKYAKIISVIFVVTFIIGLVTAFGGASITDKDLGFIALYILFLVPLFYYAWRKK
jgi:hypothetical protein